MFYDAFMKLCEMHGKTASEALRGSGLSKYAYHRWKNGTPMLETRIKLADYFGMTVEELDAYAKEETSPAEVETNEEAALVKKNGNEVEVFTHKDFGQIRTIQIDGEPWFVGKDVAEALGYGNGKSPVNAIANHVDEEDKGVTEMMTPGGTQRITIINESGVYSLIFGSKLESARRFKHWVTSEVLPTIRKTGSYSMNKDYDRMELARIISSCKSATAVKTISALFEIGVRPIDRPTKYGNDSVSVFLECYDSKLLQRIPNQEVYNDYVNFCCTNDFSVITQGNFSRRVHKLTGLTVRRRRINGELTGFFTME